MACEDQCKYPFFVTSYLLVELLCCESLQEAEERYFLLQEMHMTPVLNPGP